MIKLKDVSINIDGNTILKNIDFSIEPSDVIHISGENGSGKTTLIESMISLNNFSTGQITKNLKSNEYGYLPQVSHQNPKIYLELKDICNTFYSFYPRSFGEKKWHLSSGGERKKALIAKAITESKKLLILDEPFNHLDKESTSQVIILLEELKNKGLAIIYTGHSSTIPGSKKVEVSQWRL